jgi:molybdenum cofactor cytidylyltransferase
MIVAVVPAAGISSRMGRCKQLLPFAGTTIIGHIVDELHRSRVDEIRVVVGHQAERLREELARRRVCIIANPDYENTDMLGSIRCGLADLPERCRAVLIAPGDQPAIRAELINTLIDAYSAAGRGIVVPVHAGRRGHPILFSAEYRAEILTHYDQLGLRGLLTAHADDVSELQLPAGLMVSDMNYPEDYQRELARHRQTEP